MPSLPWQNKLWDKLLNHMTLAEFLHLDYPASVKAAEHAVCLRGRADDQHLIMLYQLDSFYLEVFFHKATQRITAVEAFDDVERLAPYLDQIPISFARC